MRINVLIADSCPVVVQGLRKALGAQRNFKIVACCSDGMSCIEAIGNLRPDIAVLDISMPGLTGLELLSIVSSEGFSTRVVFFTASVEDSELVELAAAGAYGVIQKNAALEFLVKSLQQVADGQRLFPLPCSDQVSREQSAVTAALTNREHQIMCLVSEGLSNKEIAVDSILATVPSRCISITSMRSWKSATGQRWQRSLSPKNQILQTTKRALASS
ncbi:response regulator [Bradyrhizobium ottawaense]|uniref:Two component transcriptional regulator, LuxR family n=2 Tax=Bradyrhizobium TaxID=374 RepID=A0ABY0Q523_9BRAD|nr:two component transcriptional regulator, LuxR family [Bradyrhizobium ottawaense]SEC48675.1 two component transcriptional regulator, LuxR family [Bradyrhizobium lablabi]